MKRDILSPPEVEPAQPLTNIRSRASIQAKPPQAVTSCVTKPVEEPSEVVMKSAERKVSSSVPYSECSASHSVKTSVISAIKKA